MSQDENGKVHYTLTRPEKVPPGAMGKKLREHIFTRPEKVTPEKKATNLFAPPKTETMFGGRRNGMLFSRYEKKGSNLFGT